MVITVRIYGPINQHTPVQIVLKRHHRHLAEFERTKRQKSHGDLVGGSGGLPMCVLGVKKGDFW
jgi:hypothetical protein